MQELTDIISCVILMHLKNSIHHLVMMEAVVGVFHYHQIQQQKHWFFLMQPYISLVVWLKSLEKNVLELCNMYFFNMNKKFHKIPVKLTKQHIPRGKCKSLLHAIVGGWYVNKLGQKLPPLNKRKLRKNPKKRRMN